MTPIIKKYPAYSDNDRMPWGEYAGKMLQHVPAKYLERYHIAKSDDEKLNNYVHNSWNAICMELRGKA